MTTVWLTIAAVALASAAIKAAGPVLVGGRALPAPLGRVIALLAPALLAALVVTSALAEGQRLEPLDARAAGVAVSAVALAARLPLLLALVLAAATAAGIRALA